MGIEFFIGFLLVVIYFMCIFWVVYQEHISRCVFMEETSKYLKDIAVSNMMIAEKVGITPITTVA